MTGGSGQSVLGAGGGGNYHIQWGGQPPRKWRIQIEYDGTKCEAEFEGAFAKEFLTNFVQDFVQRIYER